jgi:D-sedoheptulose 7-phosphate isomerase
MNTIKADFTEAKEALEKFIVNESNLAAIHKAGTIMTHALGTGNTIFSCGNGGSMCDAMHFAEELTGRFRNDGGQ